MRIITPFLGRPLRRAVRKLHWFMPYLGVSRHFDVTSVRAALAEEAIAAPAFETYCRCLLEYCLRTNWGEIAAPAPAHGSAAPVPQKA